ncbi:MAG: PAS domain-containing protein [Hyphomonadaceae bacterium]
MADREDPISDPQRLLASLRASEARLHGVLNSISDGFYAVDRQWRFTEFNPAAEAYFRLSRDEIIGKSLWDFITFASDAFKDLLRAAMDGAPMAVLEAQSLYRPDRQVELRIAPTDEGICVALTDITERRQTQASLEAAVAERTAALQASEHRLRSILETTHLFVGLIDLDGTVLDANSASLAAIQCAKADVVGKKLWETPWVSDTASMAGALRDAVATVARGDTFSSHVTANLPDGARSFDFTMRPVRDQNGAVIAIVPEASETTARLKAEEDLRQAQKLEAVGQLTGGIAHDFNNLLMVVSGGLNMLERADTPERRDMLIARMREAVTRGANLTKQLLAFSRRHELTPRPIALNAYFADMSDLLSRSLGVNTRVVLDIPEHLSAVMADPNALQLAVLNLAVNARDAMDDKGVVTISAFDGAPDEPDAAYVSIAVADSGVGMTPEVRARIFEPFFTTKDIGKGSGLGLAQVHGFVEQSGGRIAVVSAPGEGTTFTLTLPRARQRAAVAPPAPPSSRPGATDKGSALLVEDDDEVAALTADMLSALGWRVTRAASAEDALTVSSGAPFDLVFSDVMMPGGRNGIELARALRARDARLPIVLASGYAESVRREAEREGLALLSKPYDLETLATVIEAARS